MPARTLRMLLPLLPLLLPLPLAAQASADARALRAESLMVEAMGGRDAWNRARYVAFTWAIARGERTSERHHRWDRWTGDYRLEWPTDAGVMVAVFNTNSKEGRVWVDGRELAADSAAQRIERAYAAFINDSYWFLMPFKWKDEGVHLRHMGMAEDSTGKQWEKIQLTFEDVGLTPDNRYYCYVDPATHLMGWWEHFRSSADTAPALASRWSDWERRGPIMVSLDRPFMSSDARIFFPHAQVAAEVPVGAFDP